MTNFPYFARICKYLLILLVSIALFVVIGITLSVLWILPHIDRYRPEVEYALSSQTGYQIKIAKITGHWQGIAPEFTLNQITLSDQQHHMIVNQVVVTPSWKSLIVFEPIFAKIKINFPHLIIHRDRQSYLWINQLPVRTTGQHNGVNWLLRQKNIVVHHASIKWQDDFKKTAPIWLYDTTLTYTHTPILQSLNVTIAKINKIGRQIRLEAVWHGEDIAHWKKWSGLFSASAKYLQVDPWISGLTKNDIIKAGSGSFHITLDIKQSQLKRIHTVFNIHKMILKFSPTAMPITIKKTLGNLSLFYQADQSYKVLSHFSHLSGDGLFALQNSQLRIHVSPQRKIKAGQLIIQQAKIFSLAAFKHLSDIGLIPAAKNFTAKGHITNMLFEWQDRSALPPKFFIRTDFAKLSGQLNNKKVQAHNISGQLFLNNHYGKLKLDSQNAQFVLAKIFTDPLHFKQLTSTIRWQKQHNQTHLWLEKLFIANQDLRANLQGQYHYHKKANLVLSGTFDHVKASRITHYLPKKMDQLFRKWFSQALKDGTITKAQFSIKGNPFDFPFMNGKGGEFKAQAIGRNIRFNFDHAWPIMNHIDGKLILHNAALHIHANTATIADIHLHHIKAIMPNMMRQPILFVSGRGYATLENYLRFIEKIPDEPQLKEFAQYLHGKGNALFDLTMQIPISEVKNTFLADVALKDNAIYFTSLPIPPANHIKGHLYINERGIQAKNIALTALGGIWNLKAQVNPQKIQSIVITGNANSQLVAKQYIDFLSPYIKGKSPYEIVATIQNGLKNITLHTSLNGTALTLPHPLEKKANDRWPLTLNLYPKQPDGYLIDYMIPIQKIKGMLTVDKNSQIHSSLLQLGTLKTSLLNKGFSLYVDTKKIAIDPWLNIIKNLVGQYSKKNIQKPVAIHIKANQLFLLDAVLNNLTFKAVNFHQDWTGQLTSTELSTKFNIQQKQEKWYARLTKFNLNNLSVFKKLFTHADKKYQPTLGIATAYLHIDNLYYDKMHLGQLDLSAQKENHWQIKTIQFENPHGALSAQLTPSNSNTNSTLTLDINNIGKLLVHLGYPNLIKEGYGTLYGSLSWPNNNDLLNKQDVEGFITLNLYQGLITKINPGIANFFSLLSLQSILRFARLDFSGFTKGFVFDSLTGTIFIKDGVLQSDQLMIKGPSADIKISGLLDFKRNVQHLYVSIVPHILNSSALATGVLFNPWLGLATMISPQALKDPLEQILAVEYEISGSMNYPVVEKKQVLQ
jgi:uncharacterized protein (TIGR02099 family)